MAFKRKFEHWEACLLAQLIKATQEKNHTLPDNWQQICEDQIGDIRIVISAGYRNKGQGRYAILILGPQINNIKELQQVVNFENQSTIRTGSLKQKNIKVASYFYLPLKFYIDMIEDCLKRQIGKDRPLHIYVTGHGVGAAIATLCAYRLKANYEHLKIYTFGSPGVGNHAFAEDFIVKIGHGLSYRIAIDEDQFTLTPSQSPQGWGIDPEYHYVDELHILKGSGLDKKANEHSLKSYIELLKC